MGPDCIAGTDDDTDGSGSGGSPVAVATAILAENKYHITGQIRFEEMEDGTTRVTGNVHGITEGDHGIAIHVFGDVGNWCRNTGGHYIGDLGNIYGEGRHSDSSYSADIPHLPLSGEYSIIGRSIVIQAGANGTYGQLLACGIISSVMMPEWW